MKKYLLRLVYVVLLSTVMNIFIEVFIRFTGDTELAVFRVAIITLLAMCLLDISALEKKVANKGK